MSKRREKLRTQAKRGAQPIPKQHALIEEIEARCAFGPLFFLRQLRGFVRDRCPDPAEIMPVVEVHLNSGESFDVCHVIGAAPHYVVLAVHEEDEAGGSRAMRTELVSYESIMRVTIRAVRPTSPHMGFNAVHAPTVMKHDPMTPEEALLAAAIGPLHTPIAPSAASSSSKKRGVGDHTRGASGRNHLA